MTTEDMWRAVTQNDVSVDGLFVYAVRTTGIYCRPSCKSKLPKRENILFFSTAAQASASGFRPCKRCRSDLQDYQPMREIAAKVKRLLDDSYAKEITLHAELKQVCVSPRRMNDIFKLTYGVTLSEYVSDLRLQEAKQRLTSINDAIINIAYAVGFASLSAFYRFFKQHTGVSPAAYRKEHQA